MEREGLRMSVGLFLAVILSLSFASPVVGINFPALAADVGLLINFSVPCDLPSAISIPDHGGLLWPNILAVGYQEYRYDGASWHLVDQNASLFNHSLVLIGSLFANKPFTANVGTVTFKLLPSGVNPGATVTAAPFVSVLQPFSIPLQLLNTTGAVNTSTYESSDYVQRFGTLQGLPPTNSNTSQAGDTFQSRFSAFYAFYLPEFLSPQLATRVPRCGDERFYGLQYGRDFPSNG